MNPRLIDRKDFPSRGSIDEKIRFLLNYAILAPSTHNSQPWRFKVDAGFCRIYYSKELKLPQADPVGRDLYISMGCMIENLVLAARYFGVFGDLKINIHDDYVGEVFFKTYGETDPTLEVFLDTIPKRINARGSFNKQKLPEEVNNRINALNNNPSIRIDLLNESGDMNKVAEFTAVGLRKAYTSKEFRREMHGWIHNSLTRKKVGMPGYSLKIPFLLSFIIPQMIRYFDIGPLLAKLNYNSIVSAPTACILSSDENNPEIWIEIGRLAERIMLSLQASGMSTSIFVASLEMGELYKEIQELLKISARPQFLFCVGYMDGNNQKYGPRNSADKFLIS